MTIPQIQHITAEKSLTKYVGEPHLVFAIDGTALDELLNEWYPNYGFLGLIPTTLDWLHSNIEQLVVWDRYLNRADERMVVPILCCPDDLDFSCSLVMVDTRISEGAVEWVAFGFDQTQFDQLPHEVGASVSWLPPKQKLVFDRQEYDRVAREFKEWTQARI